MRKNRYNESGDSESGIGETDHGDLDEELELFVDPYFKRRKTFMTMEMQTYGVFYEPPSEYGHSFENGNLAHYKTGVPELGESFTKGETVFDPEENEFMEVEESADLKEGLMSIDDTSSDDDGTNQDLFINQGHRMLRSKVRLGISSESVTYSNQTRSVSSRGRNSPRVREVDRDFALWEKHTSGVASKIMSKMGYVKGQGLGKDSQGITQGIKIFQRYKRMGVGALKEDKIYSSINESIVSEGRIGVDKVEFKYNAWKKKSIPQPLPRYEPVQDLIEKAPFVSTIDNAENKDSQKILDATKPGMLEYTDISKVIKTLATENDPNLPLTELRHNLNLLSSTTKNDIIRKSRQIFREKKTIKNMEENIEQENRDRIPEKNILMTKALLEISKEFCNACKEINYFEPLEIPARLNSLLSNFLTTITSKYYNEYVNMKFDSFVVSCLKPVFTHLFSNLDISQLTTLCLPILQNNLKLFLRSPVPNPVHDNLLKFSNPYSDPSEDTRVISPFETLIWTTWVPPIRKYLCTVWDPEDCEIIEILSNWASPIIIEEQRPQYHTSVLPEWMFIEYIVHQLVIPRLLYRINELGSNTGSYASAHKWIHPWFPHIKDRIHLITDCLHRNLPTVISVWLPDDTNILRFMENWEDMLIPSVKDNLMKSLILPKLKQYIGQEFEVNPLNQNLDPLRHVFTWKKVCNPKHIVRILETEFFPKWFKILTIWLRSSSLDNNEVVTWFESWRNFFGEWCVNETIKNLFSAAESAIKQVTLYNVEPPLEGFYIPASPESGTEENLRTESLHTDSKYYGKFIVDDQFSDETFSRFVESIATTYNLVFMPDVHGEHNRNTGKLLYRLYVPSIKKEKSKSLICYIDDCVLFSKPRSQHSETDNWEPVRIEEACSLALEYALS